MTSAVTEHARGLFLLGAGFAEVDFLKKSPFVFGVTAVLYLFQNIINVFIQTHKIYHLPHSGQKIS